MTQPIADELRQLFELATMRREATRLTSASHWSRASTALSRCGRARRFEQKDFETRYETRVEIARRRLIDEAGSKGFDFQPRWAGDDRFSASAILRQAQREVRMRHEQRLARIDAIARHALTSIMAASMRGRGGQGGSARLRETFGQVIAFPANRPRPRNRDR